MSKGTEALFAFRLSHCVECETPFPEPVPVEQARDDWGDASDDVVAYACDVCAEREGYVGD